jgi:hypothetical protein
MQSYKQLLIDWLEYEAKEKGLVDVKVDSVTSLNRTLKLLGVNHQIMRTTRLLVEELSCREIVDSLTAPKILSPEFV